MALRTVAGLMASDGKFFEQSHTDEAEAYERLLEFKAWCQKHICVGGEWNAAMVANEILDHWVVTRKPK